MGRASSDAASKESNHARIAESVVASDTWIPASRLPAVSAWPERFADVTTAPDSER